MTKRNGPPQGGAASKQLGHHTSLRHDSGTLRVDARTVELIRHGGEDGSRTAWHIALAMRNAGHTEHDFVAVVTDPLNGCSQWYRELRDGRPRSASKHRKSPRGHQRAMHEVRRTWRNVAELPAARRMDVSDVHERCERVAAAAEARLSGRARATRLRVLAALFAEARRYRTVRVLSPLRTIAVEAGVSLSTAYRALLDLNSHGLIRHIVTPTAANVFELVECTNLKQTSHTVVRGKSVSLRCTHLDVWRHGDLGASGLLLHSALDVEDGQRVADLARSTGLHRNTVRRRLRDLEARGLAWQTDDGWLAGSVDPAQAVGPTRGAKSRAETRYQLDREAYALRRELRGRRVVAS